MFIRQVFVIAMMVCSTIGFAQDRDYIKRKIREWGSCKSIAMTLRGPDLALNQRNAWAGTGLPSDLSKALNELNADSKLIDDVIITEGGRWLILYGDNGIRWNTIPASLERKLRQMNADNEIITSVTFNDANDWIVISTEHVSASSTEIQTWLKDGMSKYGKLWTAHLTEDGCALVYKGGYKFLGNVPSRLKEKLRETNKDIYRLKFLKDGAYFIADKNGWYSYYI